MSELAGIDLNLLVALDALLVERNVTRAGRRIGLSQSATSHALGRLRGLFGDPILVRTARGMEPTPLGDRVGAALPRLLDDLRRTLDSARGRFDPATDVRRLVVSTNDYGGAVLVPELAAHLARKAPGIELRVRQLPEQVPAEELARGSIDMAIGTFPRLANGLCQRILYQERFVCAVRRDHPTIGKRLTLDQFCEVPHVLVAWPGEGPGVVDYALEARGRARRVAVRVPHFLVAPAVAARTDHIATLAERVARQAARTHRLRLVRPPLDLPGFSVSLVWHVRSDADAAAAWFRQQVIDAAGRV